MNIGLSKIKDQLQDHTLNEPLINTDPASVIIYEDVLKGLKSIANEYDKDLRARARAYAESEVAGERFDTDDELYREAKSNLDATYGDKRAKTTDKYQSKTADLTASLSEIENDRTRALVRASERYDDKADRLAEKAQKNGLTHSSVAPLAEADLADRRDKELENVNYIYDKKIKAVDGKISRLNASYAEALKNYELTYAVQLEKELSRLQSKRDRLEREYMREHADDKQQAYDAYMAEERKANRTYEESEGDYAGAKKENYQKRYDYLAKQLEGKNQKSIKHFIKMNDAALREYLGLYYDRFVEEVT